MKNLVPLLNEHQYRKIEIFTRVILFDTDNQIALHEYGKGYAGTCLATGKCLFDSITAEEILIKYWEYIGVQQKLLPPIATDANLPEWIFWS